MVNTKNHFFWEEDDITMMFAWFDDRVNGTKIAKVDILETFFGLCLNMKRCAKGHSMFSLAWLCHVCVRQGVIYGIGNVSYITTLT